MTKKSKHIKLYKQLKKQGLTSLQKDIIKKELDLSKEHTIETKTPSHDLIPGIYSWNDFEVLTGVKIPEHLPITALQTLDELLEHDKQREKDGFPRRIRIGKLIKPSKDNDGKVVVVPTTTEPKFYHDDSITEEGEDGETGGSGEGEDGEVIGEQAAQPEQGEGEGQGAGEGKGADHDISSDAFDLGKMLTEKFELPNLKNKGNKKSFIKYTYDLTDKNRGFGQVLDKKATLKKIIETNILLGKIKGTEEFSSENLMLSPQDHVYRILSREKDVESQAMVFFIRDYSGSMNGPPTEVVCSQHLLIYSWLMYQYQNRVASRFILHDTEAKEVPDFYTYYKSSVAGGTKIAPAYKLVRNIIEEEQLASEYNIYIFHGTDGDDWDTTGKDMLEEINQLLLLINRLGITVARNSWSSMSIKSSVENSIEKSGILKDKPSLIRMDSFPAENAPENRIIEGIKRLISE